MKFSNYNFAENNRIYWENSKNNFQITKKKLKNKYDVVIVGGGLTALSTAYHLDKNKTVLIIDKSTIGYGGSSRNGGFCCLGGTKLSYKEIEERFGVNEALNFFSIQKEAIDLVKEILSKSVSKNEFGEITYYYNEKKLKNDLNEFTYFKKKSNFEFDVYDKNFLYKNNLFVQNSIGAIKANYGFGINPKDLVFKLLDKIKKNQNIDFIENSEVLSIEKIKFEEYEVETNEKKIKSKKCIIATNGYLNNKKLNKTIYNNLIPALSNILVTEPINEDNFHKWKTFIPCADSLPLLHYFRLLKDNRIMFGGRGGHSYLNTNTYRQILQNDFTTMFPEFADIKIDYFWRGLVGVTRDKIAHLGEENGIYYAYGYNGNGVSLSTYFGKLLAEIIDKKIQLNSLPKCLTNKPQSMPFADLKKLYLFMAYQYYKIKN